MIEGKTLQVHVVEVAIQHTAGYIMSIAMMKDALYVMDRFLHAIAMANMVMSF
jgi:hypothetical protein